MVLFDQYAVALKNIRRQPLRSALTLFALVLSATIVMLMAGLSIGGYQSVYGQFGGDTSLQTITVTPTQATGSLDPFGDVTQAGTNRMLNDTTVAQLAGVTYVTQASPRVSVWEVASFTVPGHSQTFTSQPMGVPSDAAMPLSAGTGFVSNDDKGKVIIGYGYAKALGVQTADLVGKSIRLTTQPGYRGEGAIIPEPDATKAMVDAFNAAPTTLTATIVGVTAPGQDQNGVYIPLGWAHRIRTLQYYDGNQLKTTDQLARDGYSAIRLSVDTLSHVQTVANHVKSLGYSETSLLSTVQQINQLLTVVTIILSMVAAIALLAAALGVINTMLMAVSDQAFEIGILRACGATKATIVRLFVTESALLGVFGGLIGVGISLPLGSLISHYGMSLLVGQGLQAVTIVTFSPMVALGVVAITGIFSVLAGMYPAYRAARLDPSEVLSSQ